MSRRGLLVIAICGVLAGWRATAFLPSLDGEPEIELTASSAAGPRLARRVVLVILDGLRLDASHELPTLERLRARGVDVHAGAPFPSLSGPSYVTIVTGASPRYSGRRTNDHLGPIALDSVFDRARAANLRIGYSARTNTPLPSLFSVGEPVELAQLTATDLGVVVVMDIDRAGHAYGGDSQGYLDAARAADATLAEIVAALDLDRDAIVVCSDHGQADRGGHGGTGAAQVDVPIVFAGVGIRRGITLVADLGSVGSTVAALLGLAAPATGGPTLIDALGDETNRSALLAADASRAARILDRTTAVELEARDRLQTVRWIRIPIAAAATVLAIALLWRARRRIEMRVLAVGATFPLVWWGSVSLGQRWWSEPGVSGDALSLWLEHARYGSLAVIATVVAHFALSRARAEAAVIIGFALAGVCALVSWALGGRELAVLLEDPLDVVITPVAYLGMAWFAVAACLVFATRAVAASLRARYGRRA